MNGLEWKLIRLGWIDNQKTVGDVVCSRFALPFYEVKRWEDKADDWNWIAGDSVVLISPQAQS